MLDGKGVLIALEGAPVLLQLNPSGCGIVQRVVTIHPLPGDADLPYQHDVVESLKVDTTLSRQTKHVHLFKPVCIVIRIHIYNYSLHSHTTVSIYASLCDK